MFCSLVSRIHGVVTYAYTGFIIYLLLLSTGCGILHPPNKDKAGYYTIHYQSCGPLALEKALDRYFQKEGIVFFKRPFTAKELSQQIQDKQSPINARRILILFDRQAAMMTLPNEMKKICKQYGVNLVKVDSPDPFKETDKTFIILVRKQWSTDYHWVSYPIDNFHNHYGSRTSVVVTYVLEPIKK